MIDVIRSEDRGTADLGWLQSRHTFSFADYQNPERVNFGPLRVIENGLQPGYEQELFAPELKQNRWCLVGSRDGRNGVNASRKRGLRNAVV